MSRCLSRFASCRKSPVVGSDKKEIGLIAENRPSFLQLFAMPRSASTYDHRVLEKGHTLNSIAGKLNKTLHTNLQSPA
jgi:hypothetical protein